MAYLVWRRLRPVDASLGCRQLPRQSSGRTLPCLGCHRPSARQVSNPAKTLAASLPQPAINQAMMTPDTVVLHSSCLYIVVLLRRVDSAPHFLQHYILCVKVHDRQLLRSLGPVREESHTKSKNFKMKTQSARTATRSVFQIEQTHLTGSSCKFLMNNSV